ncbi:Inositol-pentakisphosphate 2-kinase [Purpureocillium takamizusanense]|uniref:Inositol-pentakisphosphate 2-kinase n=1 Tax=Purpureocillium takamizusanense TaxID=2060973 RepID=A0A9Q8Q823_9HYPO|nr:Inositol-pentakisphosphate 2-kinase [Purpureocillium takamizusanense]UNI14264.1 Inositol-pentakisphosphate 2-kinase [Purpureocillium takamizusanense]
MALQAVPPQRTQDSSAAPRPQASDGSADGAADAAGAAADVDVGDVAVAVAVDDDRCAAQSPASPKPTSPRCIPAPAADRVFEPDDCSWITPKDMALLHALGDTELATKSRADTLSQQRIRRLPRGARPVRLIGEGSANAVFEFRLPRRNGGGCNFSGLLLRVAKVPALGHPPTYNYLAQQNFYQGAIKPLLGSYAIRQELVILRKSGIIEELNNYLRDNDGERKDKFKGTFVGQTDWGFLVEDMRPAKPEDSTLIEFKPKWLSQSPSAPKDAVRCRQCAMELRNLIHDPSRSRTMPEKKPCPLALDADNAPPQASSPFRIAPQLALTDEQEHYRAVLSSVARHPAIHDLKLQQIRHDKLGPLNAAPTDPRFVIAMTLRDCTCFVQVHRRDRSVKLRMGDFDWKDPLVKVERWQKAEQELIERGFYTARWILCGGVLYRPPTLCALEFAATSPSNQTQMINVEDRANAGVMNEDRTLVEDKAGTRIFNYNTDVASLQRLLEPFRIAHKTNDKTTADGKT